MTNTEMKKDLPIGTIPAKTMELNVRDPGPWATEPLVPLLATMSVASRRLRSRRDRKIDLSLSRE